MDKKLQNLKNDIYDLEYYMNRNNNEMVMRTLNDINKICKVIRLEFETEDSETTEVVKDDEESIKYNVINVLEFLYLPFNYAKEERNDYIQQFSEMRRNTLKSASALKLHNKFWEMHESINGNIYGSFPAELISEEKEKKLMNMGWEKVEVEILDFSSFTDNQNEIMNYCHNNLDRYVIVREKETQSILVLNYKLDKMRK